MNIQYNYITVASEGGRVHIESFVKAYRSLGETVIENGVITAPYLGGKETWSAGKRLMVKLGWFVENVRHFGRAFHVARRQRPDVLLFRFQPRHEFFVAIVGLSFFYPVILEINAIRSIEHYETRSRISDILDWLSLKCARRCFVVSERLKEHVIEHYHVETNRIAVIQNGVDVEEFNPDISGRDVRRKLGLENRFVVGFVGSFRPWHGIDYLIAVGEKVVPRLPNALFLLVGDGADRPLYEKKVKEMGIESHFHFAGRVAHAEVPQYLGSMDVVIAPIAKKSFLGGFHGSPLKIFEYMAMAKSVIAPPLGQTCEVIQDGISGLLIDSEDTPKLAHAILNLHQDPALRKRLGQNARTKVMQQYTWGINASKVRSLCEEACNA